MRSYTTLAMLIAAFTLATPGVALAQETSAVEIVPNWLSVIAGIIGLATAVILLTDAVLLRRVSEGSIVAENIVYMMTSAVCFASSMLLRWVVIFAEEAALAVQLSWVADLLVTVGMALLAVYVSKVRRALQGYITAAQGLSEKGSEE